MDFTFAESKGRPGSKLCFLEPAEKKRTKFDVQPVDINYFIPLGAKKESGFVTGYVFLEVPHVARKAVIILALKEIFSRFFGRKD